MKLHAEIEGLEALRRKLGAVDDLARADLARLFATTAQHGEGRARSVAPVATGALRAAITAAPGPNGSWTLAVRGAPARYAPYVEYGTRYVSARGFMRSGKEVMRADLRTGSRTLAQTLPGAVARA